MLVSKVCGSTRTPPFLVSTEPILLRLAGSLCPRPSPLEPRTYQIGMLSVISHMLPSMMASSAAHAQHARQLASTQTFLIPSFLPYRAAIQYTTTSPSRLSAVPGWPAPKEDRLFLCFLFVTVGIYMHQHVTITYSVAIIYLDD